MQRALIVAVALSLSCEERARIPSPLPRETYGDGGPNVVNPAPVPLDAKLRAVVRTYRKDTAAVRDRKRQSLRPIDHFTLRDFAMRAAVFAIRERKREWIVDGSNAYAMLNDAEDARSFQYVLALLDRAAERIGLDSRPLFEDAAAIAGPDVAVAIRGFARMDRSHRSLDQFALEEIPTGFIWRGIDRFTPLHDLVRTVIDLAAVFERDRYTAEVFTIRTRLPETWIQGAEPELRDCRGVASVHTAFDHELVLYVAEMADAQAAERMRAAWSKQAASAERPSLGIARGNLFCLVIVLSPLVPETRQTLERFTQPIARVLDESPLR